jgi:alpha-L-rhamnosidase
LAGIGFDEDGDGAGFRKIIIKPMPVGDLNWVKGSYKTVSGLISVDWKRENGIFNLSITIPANTSAIVYVPAKKKTDVTENGMSLAKSSGVRFLRLENGKAVYEVGSGEYKFESKMN